MNRYGGERGWLSMNVPKRLMAWALKGWAQTMRLCLICLVVSFPVYLALVFPGGSLTLLIRH